MVIALGPSELLGLFLSIIRFTRFIRVIRVIRVDPSNSNNFKE